jgi:uncharacterized protein
MTVSALTKTKIAENYFHLSSFGFDKIFIDFAFAPFGNIFIKSKDDIKEVKDQYNMIATKIIESVKSGQNNRIMKTPFPLKSIETGEKNHFSCSAGRSLIAIDVNGDVFLCHRLVGENKYLIGNVDFGFTNQDMLNYINKQMGVDHRQSCRNCWARYVCGGGCYAINHEFNSDISIPPRIYCDVKKHITKLAFAIYANSIIQD